MKITNAIKKLEKAGFTVTNNGLFYFGMKAGLRSYVRFSRNGDGDTVATVGIRTHGEQDDSQADYFATTYCDSIAQAIRWANASGSQEPSAPAQLAEIVAFAP